MSRLIVKGLPGRYEDRHLRKLFDPLGEVTDARVMRTSDGRSRRFGFVGFRTREAAARAKLAMNKAYVDTSAIAVEYAHAAGTDALSRPWSRYSQGSSRYDRDHGLRDANGAPTAAAIAATGGAGESAREDAGPAADGKSRAAKRKEAQFDEFMQVSAARAAVPIWADGAVKKSEKNEMVESRKAGGKGVLLQRKHVTFDNPESEDEDDDLYEDLPKQKTDEDTGEKSEKELKQNKEALDSSVSDMDYFKSKIVNDDDLLNDDTKENGKEEDGDIVSSSDSDSDGNSEDEQKDEGQRNSAHEKTGKKGKANLKQEHSDKNKTPNGDDSSTDVEDPESEAKAASTLKEEKKEKPAKKYESDGVDAGQTGRLMVRNLAFTVTEEELETTFDSFGALSEVHIVRDRSSRKSRGMGFVQFIVPEHAAKAMVSLDGSFHSGRILHVLPAKPRPVDIKARALKEASAGAGSSAFKAEREASRREAASKGRDLGAQHALHMAADAVAEVAAGRHGVSKADLFGTSTGESGVAAVRLAVAEAAIQSETKSYLLKHGVDLDLAVKAGEAAAAGTMAAKRKRLSRTAFLIKNLPARTSELDLETVFAKFGKITRIVVVPSGVLGVVQYATASDARRAFTSLAYTKFGDTPLYLEWLPGEALKDAPLNMEKGDTEQPELAEPSSKRASAPAQSQEKAENNVEETEGQNLRSVYVKNLNFETRDAQLMAHFRKALRKRQDLVSSLRSAKVALKRGGEGKEGQRLSMGFGFLEFSRRQDALDAIKVCQNSTLDGHTLRLQMSGASERDGQITRKRSRTVDGAKAKPSPKLMVRNVPFEATRKEIRDLFNSFGQLKTVRMPKKVDGSHRGFAFVEYASKSEAKAAYEALSSTHFYGRHLVLEYATDSGGAASSLAELQNRAASDAARKRPRLTESFEEDNGGNVEGDDDARMRDEMYA